MNPVSSQTSVANNTQELLVRTLASDVSSLQHGNQLPVPERLTATFKPEEQAQDTSRPSGSHASLVHVILTILFLCAIGAAIYFFVYPALVAQKAAVL